MKSYKIIDFTKEEQDLDIYKDVVFVGLFVGRKEQFIKSKINFIVKKPGTIAEIFIRAILFDSSRIKLDCNIFVPKGMTKTDAYLQIRVLELSPYAKTIVTPALEICENDVKCGHALTISQPDPIQIDYLKSRGINQAEAIDLISQGFINSTIDLIEDDKIKLELIKKYSNA